MHPRGSRDYHRRVKFTCDRCGRSYVADEKVRERAFRMKCKQCGHQIVVKPTALHTPPPGTIPAITPLPFFLGTPLPGEQEAVVPEAAPLDPDTQPTPAQMLEGLERDMAPAAVTLPPPLPPRGPQPSAPPAHTPVATRSPLTTPDPPRPAPTPAPSSPAAAPLRAPPVPPPQPPVAAPIRPVPGPPPPPPPRPPPDLELEEPSRPDEADPFATMAAELSAELANVPEAPPLAPPDPFLPASPLPPPPVAPKLSESEEAFADLSRMMDGSGSRPLQVNGGTVEQRRAAARPTPAAEAVRPTPVPPGSSRRWAPIIGLGFGFGTVIAVGWVLASSGPVKKLAGPDRPSGTVAVALPAPAPAPPPAPQPTPVQAAAPETRPPEPAPASPPPAPAPRAVEAEVAVAAPDPPPRAPAPDRRAQKPRKESPPPRRESPRRVAEARPAPTAGSRPAPQQPAAAPAAAPSPGAQPATEPAALARASSPATVAPGPVTSNTDRPLEDKDIEATIARYAKAFEGCVAQARKAEPQLVTDQRRVTVTMTVNPNGRALYPTLDDQELSTTSLGACLKKEAGKMSFPEFGGEPLRVRVPLVLR